MPPGAYAIVALFSVASLVNGAIAAWMIGPRRPWAILVPTLAAFGSLYLIGHRFAVSVGPEVGLFGFRIALLFDAAVALAVAFVAGLAQGRLLRLLQPKQRGTGRDGLA